CRGPNVRGRIQPARRRLHGRVAIADSRIVRPVRTLVTGAGVVDAAYVERLRHTALQRVLPASLPASGHGIQDSILHVKRFSFADGEFIAAGQDEAMASVEGGQRPLTTQAAVVLREQ